MINSAIIIYFLIGGCVFFLLACLFMWPLSDQSHETVTPLLPNTFQSWGFVCSKNIANLTYSAVNKQPANYQQKHKHSLSHKGIVEVLWRKSALVNIYLYRVLLQVEVTCVDWYTVWHLSQVPSGTNHSARLIGALARGRTVCGGGPCCVRAGGEEPQEQLGQ